MWRVYPRLGGATNQPFVWLHYGGLWSDAEIIVYYYRAKALFTRIGNRKITNKLPRVFRYKLPSKMAGFGSLLVI